jgi:hypothetical protein
MTLISYLILIELALTDTTSGAGTEGDEGIEVPLSRLLWQVIVRVEHVGVLPVFL